MNTNVRRCAGRTSRLLLWLAVVCCMLVGGAFLVSIPASADTETSAFDAAKALVSEGKYDEALAAFAEIVASDPSAAADAQRMIGYCYQRKGDYDLALAEYKKLLTDYPQSEAAKQAHFWMGLCYESKLLYDEAISEFQEQVKTAPDVRAAETLHKLAIRYLAKGEKAKADSYADELRRHRDSTTNPENKARADLLIGDYLKAANDWAGALAHYQSIKGKYPEHNEDIAYHIAIAASNAGQYDTAITASQEYVDTYPDNPRAAEVLANMVKANVMKQDGNWQAALEQYQDIKTKYPKHAAHVLFLIGRGAFGADQYFVAIQALMEHTETYPDSPDRKEALLKLEEATRNSGQYAAALDQMQQLAQENPEFEKDALLRQAEILGYCLFDPLESLGVCQRLSEKYADDKEVMGLVEFLRGLVYLKGLQNPSQARVHFQSMVDNYPSANLSVEAACHVASCYVAEGNLAMAEKLFEEAATKYECPVKGWKGYARYMVGDCLFGQGKMAEAIAVWKSVATEYADCDWGKLAQSMLAEMEGDAK